MRAEKHEEVQAVFNWNLVLLGLAPAKFVEVEDLSLVGQLDLIEADLHLLWPQMGDPCKAERFYRICQYFVVKDTIFARAHKCFFLNFACVLLEWRRTLLLKFGFVGWYDWRENILVHDLIIIKDIC